MGSNQEGIVNVTHRLDYVLFWVEPGSLELSPLLQRASSTSDSLSVQVALEEIKDPVPMITFPWIVMDTIHQELHLPNAKLLRLHWHLEWFKIRCNNMRHQIEPHRLT